MDTLKNLRQNAIKHGATDLGFSDRKNKKYYVIYNNQKIHFGSKTGQTFLNHKNITIRDNWRKRHSKIFIGDIPAYKIKTSPEYWNWNLTW